MTKQLKADLSLLSVTAIWGSSFALMKIVLDHMPTFAYLSLRFIIASVVLVIIFHRKLKNLNRKVLLCGCGIGLLLFGGMALQVGGLNYTTASNSAFITGLNVVFVPIVSTILLKRKPDKSSVIGVALAFGGLFFLTGGINFRFNIGDLLTFLCAVSFTFHIVAQAKYTREYSPELLVMVQLVLSAVLYTGVWFAADNKPVQINPSVVWILIITAVFATAVAFGVQTFAQKYTSPTHTALILTAEPVFGAVFAMIIPNSQGVTESLKLNSIVGCSLILIGMLISEFRIGKKKAAAETTAEF